MQAIPKMELSGLKGPENRGSKSSGYSSLASLIRAFGEFTLITDLNGAIAGFWASHQPSSRRLSRSILGRPLSGFVHACVALEIADLADRTARRRAREELECRVTMGGVQRSFSFCAIPLHVASAGQSALCVVARDVTHRVEAMRTLADREALLAKAEEIANFGSCEIDLKSGEVKLSPQLKKLYSLLPGQQWSQEIYWERMYPSDRLRAQQLLDKSWSLGEPVEYLARYCAPDGAVRVHLAQSLPLCDENGKVVRALGVIQDVTERAKSDRDLQRLSQQLINEQDSQRRRLARELHESAGQSLASLKMTLGRLRDAVTKSPELVSDLLDSAAQLADGAIREVRTVTYLLHPPMLDDAGLAPALRWYTRGFAERSEIRTTLDIPEPFPRLSQEIEITVFRVVQEALTNVHRYSGSKFAEVRLSFDNAKLYVEIRDRGCGFPPLAEQRTELGVGISGMRERVKQLNGDFEISSIPGKGTTVRAVLPALSVSAQTSAGSCQ